jgi:hypothetical protein
MWDPSFTSRSSMYHLISFSLGALCMIGYFNIPRNAFTNPEGIIRHTLTDIYKTYHETPGFDHWLEYGEAYEKNIHFLTEYAQVNMLEIGVQSGGSSRVWKQYFGDKLKYVGADINPNCRQFEVPAENILIEIGSQLDAVFLKDVCERHGPFDFIIDDGGHVTNMIIFTLRALWPTCMKDQGIYAVEDLHTMELWKGNDGMLVDGQDFYDYAADILRKQSGYPRATLETEHEHHQREPDTIAMHIQYAQFFDSLLFLKFQKKWSPQTRFSAGKVFIPY